jgi:hypothetical protein
VRVGEHAERGDVARIGAPQLVGELERGLEIVRADRALELRGERRGRQLERR